MSNNLRRLLYLAAKEAEKSNFYRSRLGAIVLSKGKIISRGHNSHKAHGRLTSRYGFKGGKHAETSAMLKACVGDTLIVARLLRNEDLGCSKPCEKCLAMAKDFGIKKIIFSDHDGSAKELSL